jgi:hypothetical protein
MSLSAFRMNHINLRQLAGVNRVLGIDLAENCVRIVEVEERIVPLRKSQSRFHVRNHFVLEFDPVEEWLKKADLLKQKLTELGIRTRYAATSIRSLGVKVVETIIPSGIHTVDEWITENQEKLLRIPLSSGSIAHCAEILEQNDSGMRVEITFVRREEIERWQSFFRTTGLELIALGAGTRDASNVMTLEKDFGEKEEKFLFVADDSANVTEFIQGRRNRSYQVVAPFTQTQQEEALVFVSGEKAIKANLSDAHIIQPLGLSPDYCLSVGLALKALNPDLSPTNLLPEAETNRVEVNFHKSLFQRAVLFSGAVLIALLIIPFTLETYLNWRSNKLDEQLLANGSSYTELKLLETQTRDLEKQLTEANTSIRSSHTAKLLHNIASASPEGLWLYKIKLDTETKGKSKLSLFGYTLKSEKVTDYLKNLNGLGYEASLIRSGNPQQNETLIPLRKDAVTFEIATQMKN